MKKFLLLILYLLIGINLNAQENTFGIRTGVGRSTLKTDYAGSDFDFISKGKLLDARYVFGIYDIAKNRKDGRFDSLKNSYLQVGIGFKIKK